MNELPASRSPRPSSLCADGSLDRLNQPFNVVRPRIHSHLFEAVGTRSPACPPDNTDDRVHAAAVRRYRTIFISDLHLGTPGCQALALLQFLESHPSEYLYLLGDIVDG